MQKKVKKAAVKKIGPGKGIVYLTTQLLLRAVAKGSKNLELEEMELMGYVVKEQKGWVVKIYANGDVEKISKIETITRSKHLALD